ncbi:GspH/FimT family pseudopilin [Acinetobacter kookii]|uniref:GspH/FimT family pseudopilin n=1 Tax=unclassified Acinetobacter TaxID=196816 RepID=UPI0021B7CB47|nr:MULTISPECIES: GspH/FimT family pseudopilin [unclassified Acinetobacter]MCT8090780.1 GspH/FimT family pseudopilin [Acinetobacter sp. F_3_1]MCT8099207.1 GspH/FimT family pseudopilin [Acinetobacter sp. C_3_1]MCT8102280.1 GspH/FimT family pseudopilin [Acinetobacter sp. C_4_1]MCT8136027.1 GspH/FimT family pseudopilin [Acinetobacter sp. T_3_1]
MKKQSAFTLIELMVTIAILAIIATLAAPNLSQMLHNTKVNTSSGDILSFLQQSRTEAIRLGKTVIVCGSSDGSSCLSANKTNWSTGLIATHSGSTTPIQKLTFDSSQLSITGPETITFNTFGSTTAEHEITVTIPDANTYSVCVEVIGRAFKSKSGC